DALLLVVGRHGHLGHKEAEGLPGDVHGAIIASAEAAQDGLDVGLGRGGAPLNFRSHGAGVSFLGAGFVLLAHDLLTPRLAALNTSPRRSDRRRKAHGATSTHGRGSGHPRAARAARPMSPARVAIRTNATG